MKNKLLLILSTLFSLLIFLLLLPLKGGYLPVDISGPTLSVVVGGTIYFWYTLYMINRNKGTYSSFTIYGCIVLGRILLEIPFRIMDFELTLISLPDTIFHLVAITIGLLACYTSRLAKIALFAGGFVLFIGEANWLHTYWFHKINYGTYSGKIETIKMEEIFFNDSSEEVRLSDFKGSYLVLDCWHTYCGSCYRDLPRVQQLYNDYKENDKVKVYALHCWFPEYRDVLENAHRGKQILEEKGYSIPCLSLPIKSEPLIKMDIQVYPTILIFDPESNLIFRGGLENASIYLKKLIK